MNLSDAAIPIRSRTKHASHGQVQFLALSLVLWVPGIASASIFAKADGAASPGTFTGPAVAQITGDSAATARVTAYPVSGGFVNEGYTSTVFGDSTCLFCGQSMDVRITGDGSGTVKLFTGVGMSPNTGGSTFADLELDDILGNLSPSLGVNLDSFFSAFERGATTFFPFASYNTAASISMNLDLQGFDPDDPDAQGHLYSFILLAYTSYDNNAQAAGSEAWQIQESVDQGSPVILSEGSSLAALGGYLGFSQTVDTSGSPSWQLRFTVHSEALCGGQFLPVMTCPATFNSWNTTHLGLAGTFTSENGYTYDGFAAPPPEVPEPGTLALCLPAALAWMMRRSARRRS